MYVRTCEVCLGAKADCAECSGRGEVTRERCPASEAGELGGVVLRAYSQWQAGVLPAEGGWSAQASKLARLVDIAAGERARIEGAERGATEKPSRSAKRPG